jgi:hypothetical protein
LADWDAINGRPLFQPKSAAEKKQDRPASQKADNQRWRANFRAYVRLSIPIPIPTPIWLDGDYLFSSR